MCANMLKLSGAICLILFALTISLASSSTANSSDGPNGGNNVSVVNIKKSAVPGLSNVQPAGLNVVPHEPKDFIIPSKSLDPRRKEFGQLRIYQPIQPFPSMFLPRSSYEAAELASSAGVTGFDVTELSKAIEKRLKNIRNLELGVSVVQVSTRRHSLLHTHLICF